jgi:hypothetical protein
MTEYNRIRMLGNPIRAFAVLRQQEASPPRELTVGEHLARAESTEAEKARRERVSRIREKRLTYPSNVEFFRALRRAQAGEIEEGSGV